LRFPFALFTVLLLGILFGTAITDIYRRVQVARIRCPTDRQLHLKSISWFVPAGAVVATWLFLSGTGGMGFQNPDYRASNALLKDLIIHEWPLKLEADGTPTNVVYAVGYYLPAAAIGKLFGWVAANLFLFGWTLAGVGLSFVWFRRLTRVDLRKGRSRAHWIVLMFCLAGGLDTFAILVLDGRLPNLTVHLEPWAGYFQYSSNTTLLYWVPQHAIAAWLICGMVVCGFYEAQDLRFLGMSIAASMIWSPFGVLGVAPYLVLIPLVYSSPGRRRLLFHRGSLLLNSASAGIACIYMLYLASNRYSFPMGFSWEPADRQNHFIQHLVGFWFVEFALLAVVLLSLLTLGTLLSSRPAPDQPRSLKQQWLATAKNRFSVDREQLLLFLVSIAVLTALPLFRIGITNDLVMRASVPSLFLFWAFAAKVILDADISHARGRARRWMALSYVLVVAVVALGFLPALAEISRSVRFYQFGPPALSDVASTLDANERSIVEQRFGRNDSLFYRYIGK